jgi:hypothetical protein
MYNVSFYNTFGNFFALKVSSTCHIKISVSTHMAIIRCLKSLFDGNRFVSMYVLPIVSMWSGV